MAAEKKKSIIMRDRKHLDDVNKGNVRLKSQHRRQESTAFHDLEKNHINVFPFNGEQEVLDRRLRIAQGLKETWDA